MKIFVNDEPRDITAQLTLAQFMGSLALRSFNGIAVALNDAVVFREGWSSRSLADGDRLLIIQAAQGG
jgi:sulfur carrier protein